MDPSPTPRPPARPRYRRFVVTGVVVGALLALVPLFVPALAGDVVYDGAPFHLLLLGGMVGAPVGAVAALIADRGRRQRGRTDEQG